MQLRYGINPHQRARVAGPDLAGSAGSAPVLVRNGQPSYINLLDALNAWQLVREAAVAIGGPVAASF